MLDSKCYDLMQNYMHYIIDEENNNYYLEFKMKQFMACSIISELILNKKIFKRNEYVKKYLYQYLDIEVTKTALGSRNLMIGQLTKYILSVEEEEELNKILNEVYKLINKLNLYGNIDYKDINDVIQEIEL